MSISPGLRGIGLLLLACASAAHAEGGFGGAVGQRKLDDGYWDSRGLASQRLFGVAGHFGFGRSPLSLTLGGSQTEKDAASAAGELSATIQEAAAGLRWTRPGARWRPHADAGIAWVKAEVDRTTPCAGFFSGTCVTPLGSDDAIGLYVGGGVLLQVAGAFHAGLEARWLTAADFTLEGTSTSADGLSTRFTLGWIWGRAAAG